MTDAFDAGRKQFRNEDDKRRQDSIDKSRNNDEIARVVVERCKDRMKSEGYDLHLIGDTIFISYSRDYYAIGHDPNDEDDIDNQPYYDEERRSFYLFRVQCAAKNGWKINEWCGIKFKNAAHFDDGHYSGKINTSIDCSKPREDELLRIIAEFCDYNKVSCDSNYKHLSDSDKSAAEREERLRQEEANAEAHAEAQKKEKEQAAKAEILSRKDNNKKVIMVVGFIILAYIVFFLDSLIAG